MHDFNLFIKFIAGELLGSRARSMEVLDIVRRFPDLIKREHALRYRDWLRDEMLTRKGTKPADGTVNRKLVVMSAVFRELMNEGLATSNPFKGLTAGSRYDPTAALSNEDRQKLVVAPDFENAENRDERQRRLRDRCLLALLFVHGIRREEARLVKTSDVGTNQGYYTLTIRQKGGRTIQHRVHPKLYHYIELYRQEFLLGGHGYLFTGLAHNRNSRPGEALTPIAINQIVEKWAKVVGIRQRVTPHVGRATVITQALKKAPLQVVARSIGHASIESTARYDRNRNRMDQAIMTYQDCEL